MLDALLYAVRDGIRADLSYDARTCEIMADGHPPPRCGDIFVAIHELSTTGAGIGRLDEMFNFSVTVTQRVTIPLDRVGDQMLARKLARAKGPGNTPSFNSRCEQLRAYLHENWGLLQDANTNIVDLLPDASVAYGFCEPMKFRTMETPVFVGGEWFGAEPEAFEVGIKSELQFQDCRRLQGITTFI